MTRQITAAVVWALVVAAASILAAHAIWAAAFPLGVLLVTAVILWTGDVLATRIETHDHERQH